MHYHHDGQALCFLWGIYIVLQFFFAGFGIHHVLGYFDVFEVAFGQERRADCYVVVGYDFSRVVVSLIVKCAPLVLCALEGAIEHVTFFGLGSNSEHGAFCNHSVRGYFRTYGKCSAFGVLYFYLYFVLRERCCSRDQCCKD